MVRSNVIVETHHNCGNKDRKGSKRQWTSTIRFIECASCNVSPLWAFSTLYKTSPTYGLFDLNRRTWVSDTLFARLKRFSLAKRVSETHVLRLRSNRPYVGDVLYKVEKAHKGETLQLAHSIKRIVDVHCLFDPFRSLLPQLWCVSTITFDLTMQCRFGVGSVNNSSELSRQPQWTND